MKCVICQRPRVDRIACPRPIQRFVDPEPDFQYISADQALLVPEREAATALQREQSVFAYRSYAATSGATSQERLSHAASTRVTSALASRRGMPAAVRAC